MPNTFNPNYKFQIPTPGVINSASLAYQDPVNVPPESPVDTGVGANLSIPTPQQAVEQAEAPTATENKQTSLSQELADMIGSQKSLATRQVEAGNDAGLGGLAKTTNELYAQLQGLNDQSAKLQLDASAGGTIENQNQLKAEGKGITVGGLAPLTASDLRRNQIQQAGISSRALTVKSAYYAAQGQYALAKDAADKAAQVAFDADEQKIKRQQALLASLQPTLDREKSQRALIQQAALQDRAQQIDNQREDFKTGQGLAILALKNNPDDPQAQFASQQALQLSPTDPQYLQKVMGLVGKYQQDPQTVESAILDNQYKRAQIAKMNAEAAAAAKETGLDPSQLIAYAQEYAATGKIPTGLPKGTFGSVAALAKETPKQEGTLISNSTGVVPSNISGAQAEGVAALYDLTKKLTQLSDLFTSGQGLQDITQYNALKGEFVDLLSRARSGAALTETEIATYAKKIPDFQVLKTPGGGLQLKQLETLKNSISDKLDTSLRTHNASLVGFSKVKVDGQPYTIGQTVTNAKGQTGIVNSDGSITIIK